MLLLPPVEQTDRRPQQFLPRGRFSISRTRPRQQLALAMHLMTAQARNRRLVRQFPPQQTPRTARIHRRHQFPYAALTMHALAEQAIVPQPTLAGILSLHEQAPLSP